MLLIRWGAFIAISLCVACVNNNGEAQDSNEVDRETKNRDVSSNTKLTDTEIQAIVVALQDAFLDASVENIPVADDLTLNAVGPCPVSGQGRLFGDLMVTNDGGPYDVLLGEIALEIGTQAAEFKDCEFLPDFFVGGKLNVDVRWENREFLGESRERVKGTIDIFDGDKKRGSCAVDILFSSQSGAGPISGKICDQIAE